MTIYEMSLIIIKISVVKSHKSDIYGSARIPIRLKLRRDAKRTKQRPPHAVGALFMRNTAPQAI